MLCSKCYTYNINPLLGCFVDTFWLQRPCMCNIAVNYIYMNISAFCIHRCGGIQLSCLLYKLPFHFNCVAISGSMLGPRLYMVIILFIQHITICQYFIVILSFGRKMLKGCWLSFLILFEITLLCKIKIKSNQICLIIVFCCYLVLEGKIVFCCDSVLQILFGIIFNITNLINIRYF